jgi:hypothetical protein
MRYLWRWALALGAVGLGMIGCNSSSTPEGRPDGGEGGDAPYHAVFRVPGMT